MKITLKPTVYAFVAATALFVTGCNSDDDAPMPEPNLTVVEDDISVNLAMEDLDNVTMSVMSNSGLGARTTETIPSGDLCESAEITLDESSKTIIVDFGTGCTSETGITRKGKVRLTYTGNLLFPGAKIVSTFDGYVVNGLAVEGTRTITNKGVDLETNTVNLEVKVGDGKITWPDNTFVTFTSNQSRVIKLKASGYEGTISGTASGVSRDGNTYTTIVTDPLMVSQECIESGTSIPNSGVVEFKYAGIAVNLDYGSGSCDKAISVNYPGGTKEITVE